MSIAEAVSQVIIASKRLQDAPTDTDINRTLTFHADTSVNKMKAKKEAAETAYAEASMALETAIDALVEKRVRKILASMSDSK